MYDINTLGIWYSIRYRDFFFFNYLFIFIYLFFSIKLNGYLSIFQFGVMNFQYSILNAGFDEILSFQV